MIILIIAGRKFQADAKSGGEQVSLRNYKIIQNVCGIDNTYIYMFSNDNDIESLQNATVFPTKHNKLELFLDTLMLRNVCSRRILRQVSQHIQGLEPDIIFADSSIIGYLLEKCKIRVPVIVFFHNIEKNYAWNRFVHEGLLYWFAYRSYYKNEKKIVSLAYKTILLNKRDERELLRIYGRKADFILPITFDDKFDKKKIDKNSSKRKILLFVGSLFQPNFEGLVWFINVVFSQFNNEDYLLKVIGKNLEKKRNDLEKENVEVIGTVDDLSTYYYSADAVVLPIFYGDGMKVKTAEAMMYGKKIFATKEALEGYDISDIEEIYECNNKDDFYINILKYVGKSENQKFCKNVRNRFLEKYETKVLEDEFRNFLQNVRKDYNEQKN